MSNTSAPANRAVPQAVDGVDGQLVDLLQLDFDPMSALRVQRAQEVHDFEGALAIPEFNRRHVDEVIVVLAGRLFQIPHASSKRARDIDDRLAVRATACPQKAGITKNGMVTELPERLGDLVDRPGRQPQPLSSSGCSSRRFTASNSDRPLISYEQEDAVPQPFRTGGQPGSRRPPDDRVDACTMHSCRNAAGGRTGAHGDDPLGCGIWS